MNKTNTETITIKHPIDITIKKGLVSYQFNYKGSVYFDSIVLDEGMTLMGNIFIYDLLIDQARSDLESAIMKDRFKDLSIIDKIRLLFNKL